MKRILFFICLVTIFSFISCKPKECDKLLGEWHANNGLKISIEKEKGDYVIYTSGGSSAMTSYGADPCRKYNYNQSKDAIKSNGDWYFRVK